MKKTATHRSGTSHCCGRALERTACPNTIFSSWSRLSTREASRWPTSARSRTRMTPARWRTNSTRRYGTFEILAGADIEDSLHDVATAQYGWNPVRRERYQPGAVRDAQSGDLVRGTIAADH